MRQQAYMLCLIGRAQLRLRKTFFFTYFGVLIVLRMDSTFFIDFGPLPGFCHRCMIQKLCGFR